MKPKISISIDYEKFLKKMKLTPNQHKLLAALCLEPTSVLFSVGYSSRHNLTMGGIAPALLILRRHQLVVKDQFGVWHLQNPGMQAWYHAIQSSRPNKEIRALQFGVWEQQYTNEEIDELLKLEEEAIRRRKTEALIAEDRLTHAKRRVTFLAKKKAA